MIRVPNYLYGGGIDAFGHVFPKRERPTDEERQRVGVFSTFKEKKLRGGVVEGNVASHRSVLEPRKCAQSLRRHRKWGVLAKTQRIPAFSW